MLNLYTVFQRKVHSYYSYDYVVKCWPIWIVSSASARSIATVSATHSVCGGRLGELCCATTVDNSGVSVC